ncbi:hypothetical protein [Nocardia sp. NBC_01327]|uniref:hypothetical protein n=1 Tax=Nocardia sp. NBC_01327 TaxID=2903593 RepID=UPI002E0F13C4|nr:hypothetical protein OG326_36750 [Nocardia sp. NBC_01327]
MRIGAILRVIVLASVVSVSVVQFVSGQAGAASAVEQYLDLPLLNRHADIGPGGVNSALPYNRDELSNLLDQARAEGVAPTRYAALLYQFWLVDTAQKAGIDLQSWNPRDGVQANYQNLIRSYTYYENLQLNHRELQWAGMGGEVGADFGGGLVDFELMSNIFAVPGLADTAHAIVTTATQVAGPQVIGSLPKGLIALDNAGKSITPEDLSYIIGWIMVMQKNIFSDLMPMHDAYVTGGVPALAEFAAAGLFGNDILDAWKDIASGDSDRISDGNADLLHREQFTIVGPQWDLVREYKGDIGEAVSYLSTVAGSPSVAGVIPPRDYHSVQYTFAGSDGRKQTMTLPLPDWNWSVFDQRWDYINAQLLPKYKDQVNNDWPALEAVLRTPYDIQMQSHRPLNNIPEFLQSALQHISIAPASDDTPLGAH